VLSVLFAIWAVLLSGLWKLHVRTGERRGLKRLLFGVIIQYSEMARR